MTPIFHKVIDMGDHIYVINPNPIEVHLRNKEKKYIESETRKYRNVEPLPGKVGRIIRCGVPEWMNKK